MNHIANPAAVMTPEEHTAELLRRLDAITERPRPVMPADYVPYWQAPQKKVASKKLVWPPPVYAALYDDGTVIRMSCSHEAGKPFDIEGGKRICNMAYMSDRFRRECLPAYNSASREYAWEAQAKAVRNHAAAPLMALFVEHASLGPDPVPVQDLQEAAPAKRKRKAACTCPNCGHSF